VTAAAADLVASLDQARATARRVEAALTELDIAGNVEEGHANHHDHAANLADAHGQGIDAAAHRQDAAVYNARGQALHDAADKVRAAMQHVPTQREAHGG
jgi:hypothetical protein